MSTPFYVAFAALWVVVGIQTLVLIGLARAVHRLQSAGPRETEDFGLTGKPLPEFSAVAVSGQVIDNETLHGHMTALLFVSPDCGSCGVTLEELEALQAKTGDNVVVFCRSTAHKCSQLGETYRLRAPVVADEDLAYSRLFHVTGAPTAVLLGPDGVVQKYGEPTARGELEEVIAADRDA